MISSTNDLKSNDNDSNKIFNLNRLTNMAIRLVLEKNNDNYELYINKMIEIAPRLFGQVPIKQQNIIDPFWYQGFFTWVDALSLCSILLIHEPERYVEIGSGNSTRFARWCIQTFGLKTTITSIDPEPRLEIKDIADHVFEMPLQQAPDIVFSQLKKNDVIFYDGSHILEKTSDLTWFFYNVMPFLAKNVVIGSHDTTLPLLTHNTEDFIIGSILLGGDKYRVLLPGHYISHVSKRHSKKLLSVLESSAGKSVAENHAEIFAAHGQRIEQEMNGCSIYLQSK